MQIPKLAAICSGRSGMFSWSISFIKNLILLTLIISLASCSYITAVTTSSKCKIQADIESELVDNISARYHSVSPVRLGIMPFWVEESFSAGIGKTSDLGADLARIFQRELIRSQEIPVVEIFSRDKWPGRKGDYNEGNYQALMFARDAGYDLVMIGRLLPITDPSTLIIDTKVIDVLTGVTLWSGQTTHTSFRREQRELLGKTPFFKDRPEIFDFSERITELVECTVHEGVLGSEN